LWSKQKINSFKNVDYVDFLKRYNISCISRVGTPKSVSLMMENNLSDYEEELQHLNSSAEDQQDVKSPSRIEAITPASRMMTGEGRAPESLKEENVDADGDKSEDKTQTEVKTNSIMEIEDKIKDIIFKNWKGIQKKCKLIDYKSEGSIPADQFIEIIDGFGAKLTLTEARTLITKYDVTGNSGQLEYPKFIKYFLLTLKSYDQEKPKPKPLKPFFEDQSQEFRDVMLKLRQRMFCCWKEIRRTFRKVDRTKTGFISFQEFRKIMCEYSMIFSEEDFFNLISFYDQNMSGQISYDDFLRAFLK